MQPFWVKWTMPLNSFAFIPVFVRSLSKYLRQLTGALRIFSIVIEVFMLSFSVAYQDLLALFQVDADSRPSPQPPPVAPVQAHAFLFELLPTTPSPPYDTRVLSVAVNPEAVAAALNRAPLDTAPVQSDSEALPSTPVQVAAVPSLPADSAVALPQPAPLAIDEGVSTLFPRSDASAAASADAGPAPAPAHVVIVPSPPPLSLAALHNKPPPAKGWMSWLWRV